jgi:DNA-binding transcriptional ArsR family regulator
MVNRAVKSAGRRRGGRTEPARLDRVFAALAHPTRRAVLQRLSRGEATVGEVAAPFRISLPAMTRHLHVLEDAGLLRRQVDGRVHRLQLSVDPMEDAALWMATYTRFWSEQFDALERFLESTDSRRKPGRQRKEDRR